MNIRHLRLKRSAKPIRYLVGALGLISIAAFLIHARHMGLEVKTDLPPEIYEASGIETGTNHTFWLINDSGNPPELYAISLDGTLLRTLFIKGAVNHDFEELCRDDQGNLYVGDMGNNHNSRRDLHILKILGIDEITSDSTEAEFIYFSYPDQQEFPQAGKLDFDCEAMIHHQGALYLFSKNRTSTYTRMYRLPDSAGTYEALLLDSFETGGWITAADMNPKGNALALLSEDHLWLFHRFETDHFFSGRVDKVTFSRSQLEALVFTNDSTLFLADERENGIHGGQLYTLSVAPFLRNTAEVSSLESHVYPNPFSTSAQLCLPTEASAAINLSIFNASGSPIRTLQLEPRTLWSIKSSGLPSGIYFYHATSDAGDEWFGRFVIMGE